MEKTKFKVGDRVRYIGDIDYYLEKEIIAKEKATYEVVDVYNCGTPMVLIKYEDTLPLDEEDVELVSRSSEDPKTDFLTELKELMERYQVEFGDYEGYRVHFKIGNEYVGWDTSEGDVTPSNIFDYDK